MEIPINKDAILERIQNRLESENRTIALCEQIGINPEWIKTEYAQPICFGPGEQANPFFTTYAYSMCPELTPHNLQIESDIENSLEQCLSTHNINAKRVFISLKHDSFSSTGATARYHFVTNNEIQKSFFSNKERGDLSLSPFSDIRIQTERAVSALNDFKKNKTKYSKESVDLFEKDLNYATEFSDSDNTVNYVDFSTKFNRKSMCHYANKELETNFVDEGVLDQFVLRGVSSWERLISSLQNLGIAQKEDALFRLSVSTTKGNKFCRLRLSEIEKTGNIVLQNQEFYTRGWGKEKYELWELIELFTKEKEPKLFVSSNLEYFLLLGGMTRFFMGDDCIPTEKMARVLSGLNTLGISPFIYGYCPHNLQTNIPQHLKKEVYSLSKGCTILDFYEYAIRRKNAT